MKRIRFLVVEPSRLSREGLCLILRNQAGIVESAATTRDYLRDDQPTCPELVLWGPGVPVSALPAELATLRAGFARDAGSFRNVVLGTVTTARVVRRIAALNVDALLFHDISSEVLWRSLDLVMLGQRLFPVTSLRASPSEVVAFPAALRTVQAPAPESHRQVDLSAREEETLVKLADGASNKAIACELNIAEATVKVHVKALLRKIGVTNRTQAAIWAMRHRNSHLLPGKAVASGGG